MQTSQRFIDEGDTLIWRRQEQLIVIPMQISIEMGELCRGQVRLFVRSGCGSRLVRAIVVVFVAIVHHFLQPAQEGFELGSARLVGAEEIAPVLVCFSRFHIVFVCVC